MIKYNICDEPGPCWDGYVFVGPKNGTKGSCIEKSKLCIKTRGKGIQCKEQIKCDKLTKNSFKKETPIKKTKEIDNTEYDKCIKVAGDRLNKGTLKLCPRGYCTAKGKFEVYPSAYANGYATSVCKGNKPDLLGYITEDKSYMSRISSKKDKKDNLSRWFNERWVNLCKKGDGPGGFDECGTGEGINNPDDYPYCRAYYKLPGTEVVTVEELKKYFPGEFNSIINDMCIKKRSTKQGVDGKPTRIKLPDYVYTKVHAERSKSGNQVGSGKVKIPEDVKKAALLGIKLIDFGFKGGTQTGWDRAYQLSSETGYIDIGSLADMRTWFARHGPDASNRGTSYPGYCKWLNDNRPIDSGFNNYRGAVSWLIWGGNPAYRWLKSGKIRDIIENAFPKRKRSSKSINLTPCC